MSKIRTPTLEEIRSQSIASLQSAFKAQNKSYDGYMLFVDSFKGWQYHGVWCTRDLSKCLFVLILDIREPDGLIITREL